MFEVLRPSLQEIPVLLVGMAVAAGSAVASFASFAHTECMHICKALTVHVQPRQDHCPNDRVTGSHGRRPC